VAKHGTTARFPPQPFVQTAPERLIPCFPTLIVAVLPGISHRNAGIQEAACACSARLLDLDLHAQLGSEALEAVLRAVSHELCSDQEPTRLEALRWVQVGFKGWNGGVEGGGSEVFGCQGAAQWCAQVPSRLTHIACPVSAVARKVAQRLREKGQSSRMQRTEQADRPQVLLRHSKQEVLQQWDVLMPALLNALIAASDSVVMQARERYLGWSPLPLALVSLSTPLCHVQALSTPNF